MDLEILARKLFREYYNLMFTRLTTYRDYHKYIPNYDEASCTIRKQFKNAAIAAARIDAVPKKYIMAQFAAFDRYNAIRKRAILPQPNHLHGLGAQARYVEYMHAEANNPSELVQKPKRQVRPFFREERKLRGLSRMLRIPESDVLATKPGEFTQEFLEHRGIWSVVRKRFYIQTVGG